MRFILGAPLCTETPMYNARLSTRQEHRVSLIFRLETVQNFYSFLTALSD